MTSRQRVSPAISTTAPPSLCLWWRVGQEEEQVNIGRGELTDICLFVGLDEFSELKVASNDGHLETRARKRKT